MDSTQQPVNLRQFITQTPNCPKRGFTYMDPTPLFLSPTAYAWAVAQFEQRWYGDKVDAIACLDSRIGGALALVLRVPCVHFRKAGYPPFTHRSVKYDGPCGQDLVTMSLDEKRVLVYDDWLDTGRTAAATADWVKKRGARVAGFAFIGEMLKSKGRQQLGSTHVQCLVSYE